VSIARALEENEAMICMRRRTGSESGFALLLALLALLLLTFLGLTLATTTSTELQIATNYRWSRQAFYNAEAGIEVGKALLRTMNWNLVLPPARAAAWSIAAPAAAPLAPYTRPDKGAHPSRNYEMGSCDNRGGRVGYGVVLDDGGAEAPFQNVSTIYGQTLNGTFTLWVRRGLEGVDALTLRDAPDVGDEVEVILTAEGTAPYDRTMAGSQLAAQNKAVSVIETTLSRTLTAPCGTRGGQVGGGPEGSNFSPCDPITGDSWSGITGGPKAETAAR
jgi:type IV pilus assembly PilX-like protein